MDCLSSIATIYDTEVIQEALGTASLLVLLHQKQKERCASMLGEILEHNLVPSKEKARHGPNAPYMEDLGWLSGLAAEIPSLQDFRIDEFLNWNLYLDPDD